MLHSLPYNVWLCQPLYVKKYTTLPDFYISLQNHYKILDKQVNDTVQIDILQILNQTFITCLRKLRIDRQFS